MLILVYAVTCVLLVTAAGILFMTGNLNEMTLTIMGFLTSTLLAMGFIGVLPWWTDRYFAPRLRKLNYAKAG